MQRFCTHVEKRRSFSEKKNFVRRKKLPNSSMEMHSFIHRCPVYNSTFGLFSNKFNVTLTFKHRLLSE